VGDSSQLAVRSSSLLGPYHKSRHPRAWQSVC
jgi:hypothetical protein